MNFPYKDRFTCINILFELTYQSPKIKLIKLYLKILITYRIPFLLTRQRIESVSLQNKTVNWRIFETLSEGKVTLLTNWLLKNKRPALPNAGQTL
ncbi:MAG: hypothetical protein CVU46_13930 [Chloroflexi bacterium HGW-Chloroflexi-8]|nr:MAG: hypothetical protein CVU46_13930 [Chloroflexi bacterium HGW-Chloroflexi-8]